jgi:threonylcarbamoyladenosine tRNA methylthiotransferase MtaB
MGRRYSQADFAHKIAYIRQKMGEDVFLGIDVIVGFPGESDAHFQETYQFLKEIIRPAFIHLFPYSKRPGTPAATMKNQVQELKEQMDCCKLLFKHIMGSVSPSATNFIEE